VKHLLLILLLASSTLLIGQTPSEEFTSDALLIGYSKRKCDGCKGHRIKIGKKIYIAKTLPVGSAFNSTKKDNWPCRKLANPVKINITYRINPVSPKNIAVYRFEVLY
jgi:hypothetical protein